MSQWPPLLRGYKHFNFLSNLSKSISKYPQTGVEFNFQLIGNTPKIFLAHVRQRDFVPLVIFTERDLVFGCQDDLVQPPHHITAAGHLSCFRAQNDSRPGLQHTDFLFIGKRRAGAPARFDVVRRAVFFRFFDEIVMPGKDWDAFVVKIARGGYTEIGFVPGVES